MASHLASRESKFSPSFHALRERVVTRWSFVLMVELYSEAQSIGSRRGGYGDYKSGDGEEQGEE